MSKIKGLAKKVTMQYNLPKVPKMCQKMVMNMQGSISCPIHSEITLKNQNPNILNCMGPPKHMSMRSRRRAASTADGSDVLEIF